MSAKRRLRRTAWQNEFQPRTRSAKCRLPCPSHRLNPMSPLHSFSHSSFSRKHPFRASVTRSSHLYRDEARHYVLFDDGNWGHCLTTSATFNFGHDRQLYYSLSCTRSSPSFDGSLQGGNYASHRSATCADGPGWIELENSQSRHSGLTSFGSEVKRAEWKARGSERIVVEKRGKMERRFRARVMEIASSAAECLSVQLRLIWDARSVTGLSGDAASFHAEGERERERRTHLELSFGPSYLRTRCRRRVAFPFLAAARWGHACDFEEWKGGEGTRAE